MLRLAAYVVKLGQGDAVFCVLHGESWLQEIGSGGVACWGAELEVHGD
jgi:hypothetical protein